MKHDLKYVKSYDEVRVTGESLKMVSEHPELFHGSVYVANKRFSTDRQYDKFARKAAKLVIK